MIFLSFATAFANRKKNLTPKYIRLFYIYPLMILILSTNALLVTLIQLYSIKIASLIEQYFTTADFIFWIVFFYQLFKDSTILKKFVFLVSLVILVLITFVTYHPLSTYINLGISNIGKCLFCLAYFYDLLHSVPKVILRFEAVFWIVLGLFFNTAVTIPIYLTIHYLNINHSEISQQIFSLTNIAIIIMHLLFIKGQLCILLPQKR